MSLPPVPDLIPIVAVVKKKRVKDNNNEGGWRVCAPCAATHSEEVMSTERSSNASQQPSTELIDNAQSRGPSAALREPPPQPRRARSERCRHRKSDRRRERRLRASAKQTSPERPPNPRVNPIFVWVRQEDTRIVDVKCEDYDKRNRILLTKTAQGWRAIPRTETLAPLKEADDRTHHHHHHHHRRKSSRKTKVRRRSTAVQAGSDQDEDHQEHPPPSPTWSSPVNVESHLPSHKIHVPGKCLSPKSVNTSVTDDAQTPSECSAKTCDDVSPLDNLLAVAEFEFNQHMQSGEWKSSPHIMEDLIESCKEDQNTSKDYDYTEEDDNDNNLAMDDILTRLEQSLCSPEDEGKTESIPDIDGPIFEASLHESIEPENLDLSALAAHEGDPSIEPGIVESNQESVQESIRESLHESINETMQESIHESMQESIHESMQQSIHQSIQSIHESMQESIHKSMQESIQESLQEAIQGSIQEAIQGSIQEAIQGSIQEAIQESVQEFEAVQESIQESMQESVQEPNPETGELEPNLESSEALELVEMTEIDTECKPVEAQPTDLSIRPLDSEQPTDLSIPKQMPPRPPSHNSVQSPQPSGIPAVPPSPDTTKSKSVFLESLLTSTSQNIPLNSEVIIIKQKEPLDLGKSRKSASPTVTCSEEVKPPPVKKPKNDDITLKTLLVENEEKPKAEKIETPKLLELLKVDSEPDPLTQLRQLLSDNFLNVPDPMLVPKERLSQIISHPSREIPKLLKQRPELRLPEALAFPHLLQDPDILVITLRQLETIILKQNHQFKEKAKSAAGAKRPEKQAPQVQKPQKPQVTSSESKGFNELAGDIDAATTAAFNQMIWFPYLNQLEASMSFGNPDMLKMLQQPMYQVPKFPPQFPQIPQPPAFTNNFEMNMWQEAMMQANMLRPKNPVSDLPFRNYMDKKPHHKKPNIPSWNTPADYQNFLGTPNMCQPMKQNLVPPYSPLFAEKTRGPQFPLGFPYFPQQNKQKHHHAPANSMSGASSLFHKMEQKQPSSYQRHKPEGKQHQAKFPSNRFYGKSRSERKESHHADPSEVKQHQHVQPIDLSGATLASKLGLKPHFIDASSAAAKLLKHDDIPEVGSTTASVEEMQDAHKHLWHPLFGNQKDYHNSWNWSTVAAAGE